MKIKSVVHIATCDRENLIDQLQETINEMQGKGLVVEIQYSGKGHESLIKAEYSALVIGRESTIVNNLEMPTPEEFTERMKEKMFWSK